MPCRDTRRRPRKSKNCTASWTATKGERMASLANWLSPEVMRALGWALIHSLWQCVAVAALAAVVMAFLRRPTLRYLIAVTALAVMLLLPAATFFDLVTPAAPDTAAFASPIF